MNFKKTFLSIAAFLLMSCAASAHTVTLTLTRSVDDTGAVGSGYTTYRMNGVCPSDVSNTVGFTALNSVPFTTTTYIDTGMLPGTYCYVITFTSASATESVPSNHVNAVDKNAPPSGLKVTNTN
jgi:hypothetical protein